MTDRLHFILNHRKIDTCAHPGVTVLDYLRQSERLTGTKEGSREGAVVLVRYWWGNWQGKQ
jgi:xanthine dehydrogenase small subunit